MVYNVILMETIGMSVMVSIGLLFFFFAGWTPTVVVGDGDVRNLKKLQDKTNFELHFVDIKGIKIMASDVINYKYHIKSMSLW